MPLQRIMFRPMFCCTFAPSTNVIIMVGAIKSHRRSQQFMNPPYENTHFFIVPASADGLWPDA